MKSGTIHVQTENIFPIIKKFLYSDHEIFLRELVSNAVDACQKLKALRSLGEAPGSEDAFRVDISLNKENKKLTISDNGIGMTEAEIEKYINQIAFSGAEEFVNKYKDKTDAAGIIGHFGLGFYSAFMVAGKVEIHTRSFKSDAEAVEWSCLGNPDVQMGPGKREKHGTDVVLHISDDSAEFLEKERISSMLKKYCKFLPVAISFEDEQINNTSPAWVKKPSALNDEDYKNFYRELYPMGFDDPLFHIHLNVDYPFNLTGILYFPKIKNNLEVQKDKIQLYCNQVFVTDSVENIVPEFLTLLKGVIDSPDIPLNVSRSYLQGDPNVKKISNHITKKVADKLDELFKNSREEYEAKWNDISVFIKYGMISEDKFYEKAEHFFLYKTASGKFLTHEELNNQWGLQHTNKSGKKVFLYSNDADAQHVFIENAKGKGYEVLLMDGPFDAHFINFIEGKHTDFQFARVDSDSIEKLIEKDEQIPSKLNEEEQKELKELIQKSIPVEKYTVLIESLSETDQPVMVTQPEFMRRMKEMNRFGGGMSFMGQMPEMYNLVVNANHPLADKILREKNEEKQQDMVRQATDLALLSQNLLKGEELSSFIKRSLGMM
jgi:molecular chaperone HtpG